MTTKNKYDYEEYEMLYYFREKEVIKGYYSEQKNGCDTSSHLYYHL